MASRKPHTRFLSSLALMGALAGVLIWSKLRLSTNMPRSAYADPRDVQVDAADTPNDTLNEFSEPNTTNPAVRPKSSESELGESVEVRDGG